MSRNRNKNRRNEPKLISKTRKVKWVQHQGSSSRRNSYINDAVFGSEGVGCKRRPVPVEKPFEGKVELLKKGDQSL